MKNLLFAITDLMDNSLDIPAGTDYAKLLGSILMNRMGGVCFNKLFALELLSKMPKEFKNTIRQTHETYLEKNAQQKDMLKYFSRVLSTYTEPYSVLKGSYLSLEVYPNGTRISNDFDILVNPTNLTSVQNLLSNNGFEQGFFSYGRGFTKASRKQIIESRMQNGETIPFIKMFKGQ